MITKFRVWDAYLKEMYYGNDQNNLTVAFTNGKLTSVEHEDDENGSHWSAMPEDLKRGNRFFAQAFTGLKDKNEQEIYEGDILKVKGFDGWFDDKGFYYNSTVFYSEFQGKFLHAQFPDLRRGQDFGSKSDPLDLLIIGNIYQTPGIK